MVKVMFDEILRKVIFEVELLVLVVIFSLSLSSFLIADSAIGLTAGQYGLAVTAVRMGELIFAVIWLFLSVKMTVEIYRFRKRHLKIFFLRKLEGLEKERRRSETTELVREFVAFYRGNYVRVTATLALAIVVGLLVVMTAVFLLLSGSMSFWEAVFRWILSSLMLLIASAVYVYVHRSWGSKLLKVKDAEKKLSEMLGGPIEA